MTTRAGVNNRNHFRLLVYVTELVIDFYSVVMHEPYKVIITSQGAKGHRVFQQAYYPHTTYLYDSNRDLVAECLQFKKINFKMAATILRLANSTKIVHQAELNKKKYLIYTCSLVVLCLTSIVFVHNVGHV